MHSFLFWLNLHATVEIQRHFIFNYSCSQAIQTAATKDLWYKASDGVGTETCQQGSHQPIGMNTSIWVHWSGIKPGTTGFDSNLASVLPLSNGYWDKSSGQGTEHLATKTNL